MADDNAPQNHYTLLGLLAAFALIVALSVICGTLYGVWTLVDSSLPTPTVQAVVEAADPTVTPEPTVAAEPAATVAAAGVAPTASEPVGPTGRIALVDSMGALQLIDPATKSQIELDDSRVYQFPAWSPDGTQIAAIGQGQTAGGVYAVDVDSAENNITTLYNTTSRFPIYLYWSPDSRFVSFIANAGNGLLDLWLADRDEEDDGTILHTGQPFYWDWADDSSELLFHTGGARRDSQIGYLDLAGNINEGNFGASGLFQSPDMTPDRAFLAYAESRSSERGIVIEQRNSGEKIFYDHLGNISMAWNATGDQLAYSAAGQTLSAYGPLYLFDRNDGERYQLTDDFVLGFFWSPDGKKVAYFTPQFGERQPEAVGSRTRVGKTQPIQSETQVRLNLWVYDIEAQLPQYITTFVPTGLFTNQFLPFFDQYARSHRIWSPNSDFIVLPIRQDSAPVVVVYGLDGSSTVLGTGISAFWSQQ